MTRSRFAPVLAPVLVLAAAGVAAAQDAPARPPAPAPAPAPAREDRWEGAPGKAEPEKRPVFLRLGGILEDITMDLEVTKMRSQDPGGPPNPPPETVADANRRIDYLVHHQLVGAALGVEVAPPAVKGLEGSLAVIFGTVSTALTENVEEGSVHTPNPGDGNFEDTAVDRGFGAFPFAIGFMVRGSYLLKDVLLFGIQYDFLSVEATFNDEPFFGTLIEGDYIASRHRVHVFLGAKAGPARPYLSVGYLLYTATADFQDADDPNPDTWDAEFETESSLRLALGVEMADPAGITGVGGRVEFAFTAELSITILAVIRA
ncbi:MAG: hypothetical protein L0216_16090 [Planctomycetales bacterium]|nr:hypothetical protein [Planctomycetales bacterium]